MKLPVKIAETKDSRAVIVRDERGEWICETWPHIAKEIVAALNGRTAPEDGGITQALVQMARDNAIAECAAALPEVEAIALLREIDASWVLSQNDPALDAKVAGFLSRLTPQPQTSSEPTPWITCRYCGVVMEHHYDCPHKSKEKP